MIDPDKLWQALEKLHLEMHNMKETSLHLEM